MHEHTGMESNNVLYMCSSVVLKYSFQLGYLYFTVVYSCDATFYMSEGNIVLSTPPHIFNSFSYFSDEDLTQWII